MTWPCGGILAPFHQVNELRSRGHEVTVFAPSPDPVRWFPLEVPLQPFPRDGQEAIQSDLAVFVGDTIRHTDFIRCRRRFLLLQGKDYLRTAGVSRETLLQAYGRPENHILAVSDWLAHFVREKCGKSRVHVIGNGVDTARFFPLLERRSTPRLLIEGNLPDVVKNVIDAIEAASRVRQHRAVEVWALAHRFTRPGPLVDRIFEDPPQNDIPGIYRRCDLLLKTSVMEGFGLPHLEAMACGCVPATYASGGVLDFCRHGVNSLVTGVGNLPQLVGHVLRFLADDGLREYLQSNAIVTAREWSWQRVADRLEEAFRCEMENPA
jgi:glycosyltransferase involved in cell wall biosynthesis